MDFVTNTEGLLGRNVSEHVERMIFDRFLLQKSQLSLQRSLPVNPEITLMAGRIRIQLPDILVPARGMSDIEGRSLGPHISIKWLRDRYQVLKFIKKFWIVQ
ncbi:hypothetical protein D3C87_1536290 [compost metagenome]